MTSKESALRHFILIMLLASLTGCAASGYREFYSSHAEVSALSDVQNLKEEETPTIYTSDNLERDAKILISKGFVPIGESSFNGSLEGKEQAASQAVRVGALVVVIASTYSNTQTNIVPLLNRTAPPRMDRDRFMAPAELLHILAQVPHMEQLRFQL